MRSCVILFFGLAVAIGQVLAPTAASGQPQSATMKGVNGSVRDTLGRALSPAWK
jgi:hypothetical protein